MNKKPNPDGSVYLIRAKSPDMLKIGHTYGLLSERIKALQTGCPYKIAYVHAILTPKPQYVEKMLHSFYNSQRVYGEWFKLEELDVKHCILLMNKHHKVNVKPKLSESGIGKDDVQTIQSLISQDYPNSQIVYQMWNIKQSGSESYKDKRDLVKLIRRKMSIKC